MSTYAVNYSVWTGFAGVVLEWAKKRGGAKWETLLMKGFAEKAILNLASSYLTSMDIAVLGNGLDAQYIYSGVLGAVSAEFYRRGERSALQGAEELILCSLIGHRLAANFGRAFDGVTKNFKWVNDMFPGSSGYVGADIPNQGTPIPSQNSGNNATTG